MIDTLIYRLAGVTHQEAIKFDETDIEIERGSQTPEERQHTFVQLSRSLTASPMVQFSESEAKIVINEEIAINFSKLINTMPIWKSIYETAQKVKTSLVLVGIGTLIVGAWKSIPERSPLKALGTIIITFAAAYFAWQARLMEKKTQCEYKQLNSLREQIKNKENVWKEVDCFRNIVIKDGFDEFNSSLRCLPELLEARAIELLTDKEIIQLLNRYFIKTNINVLINWLNPDPLYESLIVKYPETSSCLSIIKSGGPFIESLLEKLPESSSLLAENGIYNAIQACKKFSPDRESIRESINMEIEELEKLFGMFSEKEESLLYKPFSFFKALNEFEEKQAHDSAMAAIFSEQLAKLCDEPASVKNFMEMEASEKYNENYRSFRLKSFFENAFSQACVNNVEAFIIWAQGQFKTLLKGPKYLNILSEISSRNE